MSNTKHKAHFGTRFGYIMVAAGAAIGMEIHRCDQCHLYLVNRYVLYHC